MDIKKVNFNLPVNKTVELKFEDIGNKMQTFLFPVNLKFVISCTSTQKRSFNELEFVDRIKSDSNVKSVKVTYEVTRDFNVRSKDIINKKSMTDKMDEYCNVHKIEDRQQLLAMVKELEDAQEIKYIKPKHTFTLLKATVRGAIGIHKLSKREEITVDFSKHSSGVLALCGENGFGKTTFIENCHPYPRLLSRTGKLQDHFFLKDSKRELLYIDENGIYYNITMFIDGKNKSGSVKYEVKTGKDLNHLNPVDEVSGNSAPYEKWVSENFGPVELYLRTAFFAKENTNGVHDIATPACTKGDKKALFCSLIGIDDIKDISEAAKLKSKEVAAKIIDTEKGMPTIDFEEAIPEAENSLDTVEESSKACKKAISTVQKELDKLLDDFEQKELPDVDDIIEENERLEGDIIRYNKWSDIIAKYDSSKDDINTIKELLKDEESAEEEYRSFVENAYTPMISKKSDIESKMSKSNTAIEKEKGKLESLLEHGTFELDDTCPVCGGKLTGDHLEEAVAKVKADTDKKTALEKSIKDLTDGYNGLKRELSLLNADNTEEKKVELFSTIETVRNKLNMFSYKELLDTEKEYLMIPNKDTLQSDKVNAVDKFTKNKAVIDNYEELWYENAKSKEVIDDTKSKLDILEEEYKETLISLGKKKEALKHLLEEKERSESVQEELKVLNESKDRWDFIAKAFGPDGIQALELEAFAPEIADITNNILQSSYGDRFNVTFQTLREGSDGRLIEDFNIMVEDHEFGEDEPLEWLSSGEKVWVKAALFNAFSIVRMKNSGVGMKVIFADEVDGSLDPDARLRYLKMIRTAHEECGAVQTILITHSAELIGAIEEKIDF